MNLLHTVLNDFPDGSEKSGLNIFINSASNKESVTVACSESPNGTREVIIRPALRQRKSPNGLQLW